MIHRLLDAFSLTGSIILLLFMLTVYGIYTGNEKVWQEFGTAFTTFISGKRLSDYEHHRDDIVDKEDKK